MFDNLSDKLQEIIRKASGNATLTEENMSDALREVRRALLDADVSLKVVKIFMTSLKEKALGEEVLSSLKPGEVFVKIVNDELAELLGGEYKELNTVGDPAILMLVGLQGSGKPTTIGKLANLAAEVVLPEPCKPSIIIKEGCPSRTSGLFSFPKIFTSSSCTILINC